MEGRRVTALTDKLGRLADQFECHAASRGIDQVEEAGSAMRAAKWEIDRLVNRVERLRGGLKWSSGRLLDANDVQGAETALEMAGDMEGENDGRS
jgi:hypothetical protein